MRQALCFHTWVGPGQNGMGGSLTSAEVLEINVDLFIFDSLHALTFLLLFLLFTAL